MLCPDALRHIFAFLPVCKLTHSDIGLVCKEWLSPCVQRNMVRARSHC